MGLKLLIHGFEMISDVNQVATFFLEVPEHCPFTLYDMARIHYGKLSSGKIIDTWDKRRCQDCRTQYPLVI